MRALPERPITVVRQATADLDVRGWHNLGPPQQGTSAHSTIEIAWSEALAEERAGTEYAIGSLRMRQLRGDVMIVPAGVEHWSRIETGVRAKVIGLSNAVFEQVADAMNVRPQLVACSTSSRPRLRALGDLVFDEALEAAPGNDLALDALGEALAVELVRGMPASPARASRAADDPRIRRVLAFLDASYERPVTIDAMAKVAGMSRFHFGRLFELQVGKSPYRYLTNLRMDRAADLLSSGAANVTEAALRVGINDVGRFGRGFRERFGVRPSEVIASRRRVTALPPHPGSVQKLEGGSV